MKRSALAPDPASEFSRPLRVADLSGTAEKVSANATKSEREALARRFKVREVSRLGYMADVKPYEDGWRVTGVARAELVQGCVVTLEDLPQVVEESFSRVFLPDAPDPDLADIDPSEDEDPPEPLGRSLDPAEMAAEAVALAIDPYPRKPGARFEGETAAEAAEGGAPTTRPFAALAALRDRMTRDED